MRSEEPLLPSAAPQLQDLATSPAQEERPQQQEAAATFPSGAHTPVLSRRQSLETQYLQHRLQVPCLPHQSQSGTVSMHLWPFRSHYSSRVKCYLNREQQNLKLCCMFLLLHNDPNYGKSGLYCWSFPTHSFTVECY